MWQELATAWLQGAVIAFLISLGLVAICARWVSFSLKFGPFRLFEYEGRSGKVIFALTYRGELVLLGLVGGLLYAFATLLLASL